MPTKKKPAAKPAPLTPKQAAAIQHKPLTVTLTIEDPAAIVQTGVMVLKRGDVAVVKRPSWSSRLQLADALDVAMRELLEAERNPAAARKAAAEARPAPAPKPETKPATTDDEIPQLKMSVAARLADRLINRRSVDAHQN